MRPRLIAVVEDLQATILHTGNLYDPPGRAAALVAALSDRSADIAAELSAEGMDADTASSLADAAAVAELIATLGPREAHEGIHRWIYLGGELTQPTGVLVDSRTDPRWLGRAYDARIRLQLVGDPADYDGEVPIADVVLPPAVPWTVTDHRDALERAIEVYGIEPGRWYEMEWPPRDAVLISPGALADAGELCLVHGVDTALPECEMVSGSASTEGVPVGCRPFALPGRVVDDYATWEFRTVLRRHTLTYDDDGVRIEASEIVDEVFVAANVSQDPRELIIGPRGRDLIW